MSETLENLCTVELPTGEQVPIRRRRFGGGAGPHVAILAGVRGDTPEGIRVLHVVGRHLRSVHERLRGTIDLYPCVNPLAAHHGARNWPGFDVDLARRFPGRADGHAPDQTARALVDAVRGADQVIELRGAHPAFREETQAHVRTNDTNALERAMRCNVRVVWQRATLVDRPNTLFGEIPGLISLEGGVGNQLTDGVGQELADGLLNLLAVMDLLPEADLPFHWATIQRPTVATDEEVVRVHAERGGLFLPAGSAGGKVALGQLLGEVVEPFAGELREAILSPMGGRLMAVREQPVVYPGCMVARIVAERSAP